jgi:hypothetical protein
VRELVTTLLDAVGLLLVAAGLGLHHYGWILTAASPRGLDQVAAGAGLSVAGGTVLAGVRLADWLAARAARPRSGGGR